MVSNMVETKKPANATSQKGCRVGGEGGAWWWYSLQREVQQLQQRWRQPATATNSIKSLPLKLDGLGGGGDSAGWGQLRDEGVAK